MCEPGVNRGSGSSTPSSTKVAMPAPPTSRRSTTRAVRDRVVGLAGQLDVLGAPEQASLGDALPGEHAVAQLPEAVVAVEGDVGHGVMEAVVGLAQPVELARRRDVRMATVVWNGAVSQFASSGCWMWAKK